jgi:hypothetical protein
VTASHTHRLDPLQTDEETNVRVDGDTTPRQSQSQHMESTFRDSAGKRGSRRRDATGPLESASKDMRLASERFAVARLRSRRLASLLMRTDQMLMELEVLNVQDVERTPESWLWQLAELVADLPFEYQPPIGHELSPTAAIDVVFEIQEGLLRSITGRDADDDSLLETAS